MNTFVLEVTDQEKIKSMINLREIPIMNDKFRENMYCKSMTNLREVYNKSMTKIYGK